MTFKAPRIAMPEPTSANQAYNQRSIPQYLHAVEAAGGIPVLIPLSESDEVHARILADCSGVLLPGSPADVDPLRYGQAAWSQTAEKDSLREKADDAIFEHAFATGKPVLGVCFGLQSLNVWRHGTLIQDLPQAAAAPKTHVNHDPGREVQRAHPVLLTEHSRLGKMLGRLPETELFVNSSHHQAIAEPGQGLKVVGTSPMDGVVEAIEGEDPNHLVLAVQW